MLTCKQSCEKKYEFKISQSAFIESVNKKIEKK